ncbi:RTA1 like protein-domain-containing protein [Hygrophoropsis aurantiaca]|uniref:RTA1 like protein-domain-containing protein n=1 Tax=Hygrophoropsis aurantiaca TaxID=72124 RepID=A0ACB8AT76_9AGAM|nr:RTA1 like protein-domain-containing protein [Hygrophoropsis aurantiaca]
MSSTAAAPVVIKIGPYHYIPTEWICAISYIAFLHTIRYRLWWLFPTVVFAGAMEILGWSARLWSSKSPHLLIPYEIQLVGTILAPTPLVAANFVILGKIIGQLGTRYSRLTPKWYTIIFCSFDVACLIVQAVGGAQAAFAVNKGQNPAKGGNIMLGGIVAQMISIAVYVACAGEFFLRYFSDSPVRKFDKSTAIEKENNGETVDRKMKFMIFGLLFDTTCIFIRSVYRTIELANGFAGPIISTQVYFNVLDGAMVTLAIFTLNVTHPGALLSSSRTANNATPDDVAKEDGMGER